jgi:hypothetical protein
MRNYIFFNSVRLDFQSMSIHSSAGEDFKIRRLECRQRTTQYGSETWYETPWMWYELESSRWIKCETSKVSHCDLSNTESFRQYNMFVIFRHMCLRNYSWMAAF